MSFKNIKKLKIDDHLEKRSQQLFSSLLVACLKLLSFLIVLVCLCAIMVLISFIHFPFLSEVSFKINILLKKYILFINK